MRNKKEKAVKEIKTQKTDNESKTNVFKKIFVENIGYKLLALGVACVMWVIVVGFGLGL